MAARGAEPVRGDLDDVAAMRTGAGGANSRSMPPPTSASGARPRSSSATTSRGTRNALEAPRAPACGASSMSAPRRRCSRDEPLVNVNEDAPLRPDSKRSTRPRRRWPSRRCAMRTRRLRDGRRAAAARLGARATRRSCPSLGRASKAGASPGSAVAATSRPRRTSTTPSRDSCWAPRGAAPAASTSSPTASRPSSASSSASCSRTNGVEPPDRNMPAPVARFAAAAARDLAGVSPEGQSAAVTRLAYWLSAQECTIDISRARAELGYEPVRTREDGLEELRRQRGS